MNSNPPGELKIRMLPPQLRRISSEDLLYSEYALISEFQVVLYPETAYSVNIINDTRIAFDCFASKICSQFREDYPFFKEVKSLRVLSYLKKEGESFVPLELNDFCDVPSPLYVELSSNEVWVNLTVEIRTGGHSFNAEAEALLNRLLTKEDTDWCLIKTIISMWNHTYREKTEFMSLNYLISQFNIAYGPALWFEEAHKNKFHFDVSLKLKLISVEELIFLSFQSKYTKARRDKAPHVHHPVLSDKFAKVPSFHSFSNEVIFEKEYKLIRMITHSQIFKLNKANKVYVHFSSWRYKVDDLNNSFYSEIDSMDQMHVIVRPKVRSLQLKDKQVKGETKYKAFSFKHATPIVNELGNMTCSTAKKYKEKSNDDTNLLKKKKKVKPKEKESDATPIRHRSPFEKVNIHSNLLFRTFEGDNSDNGLLHFKEYAKANGNKSDRSDDSKHKPKPSIARDLKKEVNKAYILNLITKSSFVKIPKFTFDKFSIPRIRHFKQKITLKSFWNHYKAKCSASCSVVLVLFVLLIISFFIFYFVKL